MSEPFPAAIVSYPWRDDYKAIAAQFPHFKWQRIWIYLAWASQPLEKRRPATEGELAEILGCTTRAIRNWKAKDYGELPNVEQAVAYLQAAPLLRHRRDIFNALVAVATMPDTKAHADRKLALEMTGDYTRRQTTEQDIGANVRKWLRELRKADDE